MSGLARYFHSKGICVNGYDKTPTELTKELEAEGIKIHYEDNTDLLDRSAELVIYTPAVPDNCGEMTFYRENGYSMMKRSEVLGELTKDKFTIAVAGTHGKTSITTLISHLLKHSGKNVSAFIGGISKNYNSNVLIAERTDVMVVEADEYDRSFHALFPDIAVISAMDADHLDIYGSKEKLEEAFMQFASHVKKRDGTLIMKKGLPYPEDAKSLITYSLKGGTDAYAENIMIESYKYKFDLVSGRERINNIEFSVPGMHNIENAVAAATAALLAGLEAEQIKAGLESYEGVVRRFDYRVNREDLVYIDDYAHHPEELKACISAVKEFYKGRKVSGIFQPHLYSRTRDLAEGFAEALDMLDELILLDIYPARELPIEGVTSKIILDKMNLKEKILCSKDEVLDILKNKKIEVLLTLGAGDIDTLVKPIENLLKT